MFALYEAQQLQRRVFFLNDGVADVGAVKAADKLLGIFQLQTLHDVGPCERICGGGECQARHACVALVQHGEGAVLGAKVVAPLAHAMRFVNGKQAELPLGIERVELRQKAWRGDALWRGVEQGDVAPAQPLFHRIGFFTTQAGVEKRRLYSGFV